MLVIHTPRMVDLDECRHALGRGRSLSAEELMPLLEAMYSVAHFVVDFALDHLGVNAEPKD